MVKEVIFNPQVKEKLLSGVRQLATAVGTTLGPKGSNVIIETPYGATTVTKDGVTVAKQIELKDPIENMGASIVKQAAESSASVAGDGTTTATVLSYELIKKAHKLMQDLSLSPIAVKRGFDRALTKSLEVLKSISKPISQQDIEKIATISANNDPYIGSLINEAYSHASSSGLIQVDDSQTGQTFVKTISGSLIDRGYLSPYFINNSDKKQVNFNNPLFLITDKKVRSVPEIEPAMRIAVEKQRPLVIIADEVEAAALQVLLINKVHGRLQSVAIKAPAFGSRRLELLQDLAALTNSNLISEIKAHRLEDTKFEDLGSAQSITVSDKETIITGTNGDVSDRIKQIKFDLTQNPNSYEYEKLTQRLSILDGKASIIYVGASTETELKEKKDRIDDAIRAIRAAIEKGYVIGGGYALVDIVSKSTPDDIIEQAFLDALTKPAQLIMSNSGKIVPDILEDYSFNGTYNSANSTYEDLIQAGIIDPSLVTEQALVNSVSAASMIILSQVAIYSTDRTPPYSPGNLEDYK